MLSFHSDSGTMMFLFSLIIFTTFWGFVVTITPIKSEDHVLEGENITLGCKFDGYVNNLQWYRQYPASKPEFLLLILHSTSNVQHAVPQNPRLHTRLDTEKTLVFLEISSVKLSDSAIYYCALHTGGVNKIIFGRGTKLMINSKTKAKPKYYKLARDNTTACLGIDLNSINGSTDEPDFLKESEATRIVGDSYYSKAAIMSTYDQCPTLDGKKCEPGAGGGVEPDEKLNFLSLSVLGLRILFLKTIAFNILMTVRYWMR